MTHMHKFVVDEHRAALVFRYFNDIHMRLHNNEIANTEEDTDNIDIGDPYSVSMRTDLGVLEDGIYSMKLDWMLLCTITCGDMQRFVADITITELDNNLSHVLIVEQSDAGYCCAFYSEQEAFHPKYKPDEILGHIILRDLAVNPCVHCRED